MIRCYEEPSAPLIHVLIIQKDLLPSPACNPHAEQRIQHPVDFKFKTPLHTNGKIRPRMEFPQG